MSEASEEQPAPVHASDRIFLVGHSNGGMLVHRFLAERPGRVRAAAVVAGTIGGRPSPEEAEWRVPAASSVVPLLLIHGMDDHQVAYHGGPDARRPDGPTWISAADSARHWSRVAGCAPRPRRAEDRGGYVQRELWHGSDGCRVELHSLRGWGHPWPSGRATAGLEPTHPLHGFDVGHDIWRFFSGLPYAELASTAGSESH